MKPNSTLRRILAGLWLVLLSPVPIMAQPTTPDSAPVATGNSTSARERLLMDSGWKFHLGDLDFRENIINAGVSDGPANASYDDSNWRTVNLPHDWVVELPYDARADGSHGYKPIGWDYPSNSIAWYRREFDLPGEDKRKRLWLEFDGVYRNCRVFLNGYKLIHHESGYNSFRCDITDKARCGGRNVVAVCVDATESEGWFYEGAGIYRHVWLTKTAPLAIAPDGVFVYTTFSNNLPAGPATVHFQTSLCNQGADAADAKVRWQIIGPGGEAVATTDTSTTAAIANQTPVEGVAQVPSPVLWSPESPKLYHLVTTVETGGQVVDREETEFGIRTMAFDADRGFLLNGAHYDIRGTCNHQDHAGVGSALPDALQYFRVKRLKEMGCNALRTSHNEPTAELLQACDRLGLLVMDETRYFESNPESLANLKQQVCRDRNHPCVFIWSLGNEEPLHASDADQAIAITMRNLVHRLDPTRLCTAAVYDWPTGAPHGLSAGLDVQGFNYFDQGDTDAFHKNNPHKPSIGTEEGMAQYTRGIYENNATYLSAADSQKPGCRHTAEASIAYYAARPWIAGMFFWTGFDYRGEPSPFGWPNICSDFGILDTCGFPKDIFFYLQSCWSDKTVLHLLPHWNWPGKIGQDIDVWCFSNCRQVELFLNGRSLGKKEMPRNSHLEWRVKYEPGALSARGFDAAGQVIAEASEETTGAPARLTLSPDRATIDAGGEDCSVVTVTVTDAQGRMVPVADNLIHFELSGPGKIIGVGNGDAICHEPDVYFAHPQVRPLALGDWRMAKVPGTSDRPEANPDFDDRQWAAVEVRDDNEPLAPGEMAVYRAHVPVTATDLDSVTVKLKFGMIDDEGWVYVNGQPVGESKDWRAQPSFEVRKYLHAGDNVVAVVVKNIDGTGGLGKGVALDFELAPVPAAWQRSAFNGLAQVIVQAGRDAGEIRLTARADGLDPAALVIQTQASHSPPTVP